MTKFVFNPFTSSFDVISTVAVTAVGSTPNADGLSISASQVLNLEPADGTHPGALTAGTQTIGGAKTFINPLSISGSSDAVQLSIMGNSSQTNNVIQVLSSGFASLLSLNNSGDLSIGNNADITGRVQANYYLGPSASPSASGVYRLSNTEAIGWRNNLDSGDKTILLDTSDIFQFDSAIHSSGNITGANLSGTNTGDVTLGTASGLSLVGQVLSLALASTSTTGALSSTDWNTFNNKQAAGNYITALTSDVTASGPGSAAATIANNVVTDAKIRQSAALSLVGRSANSIGNVADIVAASDNQVFRRSGTSIGFGALDLSQVNTVGSSILGVANGGTNAATFTAYSVLCAGTTSTGAFQNVSGVGTSGQVLTSNGASALPTWQASAAGNNYEALTNVGIAATVATNALTVALKQADGSTDPSTGAAKCTIGIRSATATNGGYSLIDVTSALSVVVPSSATLGQTSAMDQYVWVYAINNSGAIELAVSGVKLFADNTIVSTTAISSGSTSGTVLYSTTSRSNVPCRVIGRILIQEATAGTWASAPTRVEVSPQVYPTTSDWTAYTPATNGYGTPSNVSFWWKRDGDNLIVKGTMTTGSVSGTASIGLPSGLAIDNNKTSIGNTTSNPGPKVGDFASVGAGHAGPMVTATGTSTALVYSGTQYGNANMLTPNGGQVNSSSVIAFNFQVPIAGWSQFGP